MTTVRVVLGERSYSIQIQPGSLSELGGAIAEDLKRPRVMIVTTPRVRERHLPVVTTSLERVQLAHECLEVPDGERAKTLRMASRLYDRLIELEADRQIVMLALGGGAVGDLTGFVASTFLRGVPLVQVPTTLLAQVDASVGGKTAVNHSRGKNLIGSFYQPRLVWIDPDVLATLPPRELRSGLAEVVKAAAIWDEAFFRWLEENVDAVLRLDRDALSEAIWRACSIKAEVVSQDEREAGLRALLNFGHTLAHAIENVASYKRLRHGEAVSIGMLFASQLSETLGYAPEGVSARLRRLLERIGLPTDPPDWREQRKAYLRAIGVDKKMSDSKVGFVMLKGIGSATVVALSAAEILEAAH